MDVKWLSDLEKKIEAVTKQLQSLRKENTAQKTKIEKLEEKLGAAAAASKPASAWQKERAEIRKRVEKLSTTLEKLL